jgi:hypothetical protein
MGNISASIKKRTHTSAGKAYVVDLTFSNSYATNGDSLPANSALGMSHSLDAVQLCSGAAGYVFGVDHANRKIKAFRQKDPADAGGADIALPEVANTVDLSAVTVRAVIYGDMPNP